MRATKSFYAELALTSAAALILEVAYTRIFSFKLYYYFTYLLIGIALLGLGVGAVAVAMSARLRAQALGRLVGAAALTAALAIVLGYVVVARTELVTLGLWTTVAGPARLALVCGTLLAAFAAIGVLLAAVFAAGPRPIERLYAADLAGAAAGAAAVVPLIALVGPPACVMVAAALSALAAASAFVAVRSLRRAGIALAVLLAVPVLRPALLPEVVPDTAKHVAAVLRGHQPHFFARWSPVFRVDVSGIASKNDTVRVIHHDGLWGSTLHRYDGNPASLARFEHDERAFAFRTTAAPPRRVLIIGAAGGHEVLAALHFGAERIDAVELNPVTVSLLTRHFADYTGRLADDPRVRWIVGEARSFLAANRERYDLIFFVAPDSYAAMNAATAGAFVLSESYLYTVEMVVEALRHLDAGGMIAMQFGEVDYARKPNRTARYLTTARAAFDRLGGADFARHVLVATTPGLMPVSTILVKPVPFTATETAAFVTCAGAVPGARVRHAWPAVTEPGPVHRTIASDPLTLARFLADHPYRLGPVTDDAPFFWHFVAFGDVLRAAFGVEPGIDKEEMVGERVLLFVALFSPLFALGVLALPLIATARTDVPGVAHPATAAYFAAIGLGFMFLEVGLIQKLTLLLGYPTYSLTVTLAALLAATGLGSLASSRVRGPHRLRLFVSGVVVTGLVMLVGLAPLSQAAIGLPLALRVAAATAAVAAVGVFLGGFMPLGLERVAAAAGHAGVAWSWAVNGFFSVIGATLATVLSMSLGFSVLFLVALGCYLVAGLAFARMPGPAPPAAPAGSPLAIASLL